MDSLLSLHNVNVTYKRHGSIINRQKQFEALKSINLEIYPGETLGIVGRNGAGKSTLLRVLSGILKPSSGEYINRGATVALLALQAGFDPNLNGRDNAIMSGMLQGFTRKEIISQLESIKDYSELADFFYEPIRTYSTGMTARLGFSISTFLCPDILLIDEILSVGDKEFREKAEKTMITRLESSQTAILVSHSHEQIKKLCDRAVLINDGHTIAEGDPVHILNLYDELLLSKVTG